MASLDLGRLLEESGAILRGHFVLTSGRHSDVYFEKFRVLERPDVLSALCAEIAAHYAGERFDAVAGPTTGGILVAFEVARHMGLPAVYVETENGAKTLRRGKTLAPGARLLVVDDVLTTGRSLLETRDALEAAGGTPAAYAVLLDRTETPPALAAPLFSAYRVRATSYAPDGVPASLRDVPVTKPGTRS